MWVIDDEVEDNEEKEEDDRNNEELVDRPQSVVLCVFSIIGLCLPNFLKVQGKIKSMKW